MRRPSAAARRSTFIAPCDDVLPRLISGPDRWLALPEPRQLPHAGASWIDVSGDVNVDQVGPVGLDAPAHRLSEIGGAIDAHAFDAGRARHGCKVRIVALAGLGMVEVGRKLAAAEIAALQAAD